MGARVTENLHMEEKRLTQGSPGDLTLHPKAPLEVFLWSKVKCSQPAGFLGRRRSWLSTNTAGFYAAEATWAPHQVGRS